MVCSTAGSFLHSIKSMTSLSNLLQDLVFSLKLSVLKISCSQHLKNQSIFALLNNMLFRLEQLHWLIYFVQRKFIKRYIPKNTILQNRVFVNWKLRKLKWPKWVSIQLQWKQLILQGWSLLSLKLVSCFQLICLFLTCFSFNCLTCFFIILLNFFYNILEVVLRFLGSLNVAYLLNFIPYLIINFFVIYNFLNILFIFFLTFICFYFI